MGQTEKLSFRRDCSLEQQLLLAAAGGGVRMEARREAGVTAQDRGNHGVGSSRALEMETGNSWLSLGTLSPSKAYLLSLPAAGDA